MTSTVSIPRAVGQAIIAHARRDRPNECSGFLLGIGSRVLFAMETPNAEKSPVLYRIDDRLHLDVRRWLRAVRPALSIVGVYHSHPAGDPVASPTDIEQAMYPEWVYLIAGLRDGTRPAIRAYRIRQGRARAVRIRWNRTVLPTQIVRRKRVGS